MLSPNTVTRSARGEGLVQHSRCLSFFSLLFFFLFPKLNPLFKLSPEAWNKTKTWLCFTNPSPFPKHLSATHYEEITSAVKKKCLFSNVALSTDTQGGGVSPGHEQGVGCSPI